MGYNASKANTHKLAYLSSVASSEKVSQAGHHSTLEADHGNSRIFSGVVSSFDLSDWCTAHEGLPRVVVSSGLLIEKGLCDPVSTESIRLQYRKW